MDQVQEEWAQKLLEQGMAGLIVAVIVVPMMYMLFKEMKETRLMFQGLLSEPIAGMGKVLGEMRTVLERLATLLDTKLK